MKRLFMLRLNRDNSPVLNGTEPAYFSNKMEAKKVRDELNSDSLNPEVHVSRGPDHMGKHGHPSKQRENRHAS